MEHAFKLVANLDHAGRGESGKAVMIVVALLSVPGIM